jgi:hypothetical protein
MSNVFNYDWFTGNAFENQQQEARFRCALKKFPDLSMEQAVDDEAFMNYAQELEVRTLLFLRDGVTYEVKERVDVGLRGMLTFECEPVDDQYKVGAFVVSLLFEEVVRVEVFAVHPSEKPEETPLITGFRAKTGEIGAPREDLRDFQDPRRDSYEQE